MAAMAAALTVEAAMTMAAMAMEATATAMGNSDGKQWQCRNLFVV